MAALMGLVVTGYSQGQVAFNNGPLSSAVVDYNAAPTALTGSANYNMASSFTIQLWYIALASAPTAASKGADAYNYLTPAQFNAGGYTLQATTTGSAGSFDIGVGEQLFGTVGGQPALLALVAWDGSFANLAAALAANAKVGIMTFVNDTGLYGGPAYNDLTGWDAATASPAAAAYSAAKAYGGSDLILSPVPEPSTLVLGTLGALSFLAIRRRK
jgi:hypothetical protein